MIGAAHGGVERREDPIGVLAIDPDVAVEVRLEHVRFIERRTGVVGHCVVWHAVERGPLSMTSVPPRLGEHQVLDGNQFE